jgi:hypothetical protein
MIVHCTGFFRVLDLGFDLDLHLHAMAAQLGIGVDEDHTTVEPIVNAFTAFSMVVFSFLMVRSNASSAGGS